VGFLWDSLASNFDFAFVFTGGGEIIGKLQTQPRFFGAAERLG
jgi:proteasome assembly chaperone (PAC2) family protein